MSVKHVKAYYEEICNQYHDYLEELRDFEELCMNGMVPPEQIENAKKFIEPLKDNWMKLNYIIWLLNKPNKKEKKKSYERMNKQIDCVTDKEVFEQNQGCIDKISKLKG